MKFPYGKNVFLTGGSSGIGLATARLLAENGYTVYAASRNPPQAPDSQHGSQSGNGPGNEPGGLQGNYPGGGAILPVKMDVRDPLSVDAAAEAVLAQADIGIVIHSAGIGIACPAEDYPPSAVEGLMETNFTGVLLVNSRFLPHMRQRGGGLCLIVGSLAGIFPIPFQSHYSASKAALDLYAASLRMELRAHRVRVGLILPGDTDTGFTGARVYHIDEASPYYGACLKAVQKMEKDEAGGRPPESAARAILRNCRRKHPPLRTIVGLDYKLLAFLRRLLPDRLVEAIIRSIYMEESL